MAEQLRVFGHEKKNRKKLKNGSIEKSRQVSHMEFISRGLSGSDSDYGESSMALKGL